MSFSMQLVRRVACVALVAIGFVFNFSAQAESLTIATSFGPTDEVPDPRAGYNGWLSNQSGVTETLMGIDYDMNLYPRVAESIDQASPTQWRVTLREGMQFHDGSQVKACLLYTSPSPRDS